MDIQSLREARYRQPFVPFLLRLKGGREILIDDGLAMSIHPVRFTVIKPDGGWEFVMTDSVEEIVSPVPAR